MPTLPRLLLCLTALAPLPVCAQESQGFFFLVTGSQLTCLRDNADAYAPKAEGQTVFVTLADCAAAPDPFETGSDVAQFSTPDITLFDSGSTEDADAVVALSAQDFACLARLDIPTGAGLMAWYPEACDVQPHD